MSAARKKTKKKSGKRLRPVQLTVKALEAEERDEGPRGWFLPIVESTYTRLSAAAAAPYPARPVKAAEFKSSLRPEEGESSLARVGPTAWHDRLGEYKRRKAAAVKRVAPRAARPAMPFVPGGTNWLPLGPTVVLNGQTVGSEAVGGRVPGIAVAPGGLVVYAASANGGVFRSDDGGTTWRSLMDGFDLDPTNFATASLVCGAIAIDPANPSRIYVGTGEGDTHQIFQSRITNALPAYRGIGPIRSDDAGATWVVERSGAGSPELAGEAFFALAVDPGNAENVLAATTGGLFQRVPKAGGGFEWVQRRAGVHSSVGVASGGGVTQFFAAAWGTGVFRSADCQTWTPAGTGFPSSGVGRIAIGLQPNNPQVVYAFVANTNGAVHGLYRMDSANGAWKKVSGLPDVLPTDNGRSQGDYDLAIAVDPQDANLVYLGGSYVDVDPFPGSVWRCAVKKTGAAFSVDSSASIGTHAHADVHWLVHTPGEPDELWCGCDGGVFLNRGPRGTGEFASQNQGLACLCTNFIAQHPTDPGILFTGLQDNGTARTAGSPMWSHVSGGDGGYCLVNWADPNLVLVFANGRVLRSTTGGTSEDSWSKRWNFPWATMTQPIVSPPYKPASPADANVVAVGAGQLVFVSMDFGASWPDSMTISLPGSAAPVFALAFASPKRLFIGTTRGEVFRADLANGTWALTRIDDAAAGPLGLPGLVSDIAVDWADASLASVYLAFGGMGDNRRVWRYDGTKWEVRSGLPGPNSLLDVEHNALAVDPAAPANVYVGADIGVWRSSDSGLNWQPLENGLPDAPVYDLQIHPTQRLLRAATHGRGVYELTLP